MCCRTYLIALLAFLVAVSGLKAQSPFTLMQDTSLSFQQVVALAGPMLDSMRMQNGGVRTHDERIFSRWVEFWSNHIDYYGSRIGGDFKAAFEYHRRLTQGEFPFVIKGLEMGFGNLSVQNNSLPAKWES